MKTVYAECNTASLTDCRSLAVTAVTIAGDVIAGMYAHAYTRWCPHARTQPCIAHNMLKRKAVLIDAALETDHAICISPPNAAGHEYFSRRGRRLVKSSTFRDRGYRSAFERRESGTGSTAPCGRRL
ncbi:hypothetical protein EVAR_29430_1 [Eumeta japonica]|uniref:Uncharacterized protein n=1 Tax=Eumeta variegata TaxID=151549 RepID=A0A4C1VW83_EUMVA|nr:hypothetical protein EVAR_29430_1 [Eumeta japonica]